MGRTFLAIAVLTVLHATVATAQITTYVAPPRAETPRGMIATADSARRDSVANATMTNMKAWVDSAAGVPVPATVGVVDSAALANDPGTPVVTTFSEGAVAPATASRLPALALIGVALLALGATLLATRSRG